MAMPLPLPGPALSGRPLAALPAARLLPHACCCCFCCIAFLRPRYQHARRSKKDRVGSAPHQPAPRSPSGARACPGNGWSPLCAHVWVQRQKKNKAATYAKHQSLPPHPVLGMNRNSQLSLRRAWRMRMAGLGCVLCVCVCVCWAPSVPDGVKSSRVSKKSGRGVFETRTPVCT
ncbi:hypothetical protein COCCADRAFT_27847 [Bipolaris zeicola 26-R-13]|uniref:Uncharacterized protein n=1 Tax=Cochliobolus carbonum (strain 26-R-13) TaxID=930089 RepID=W6Y1F0_COCC2|nr:uncharacterized protein COCCADRAFT_27847 [Bipolaris zeicola 26-R-13]EUC31425.1 hypothetical protein COCCADRAFT_27847 [Bipolaris zeicola 26-R-13]